MNRKPVNSMGENVEPTRTAAPSPEEVCATADLTPASTALLRDGMSSREYLALLHEQELYPDAVKFLAHALPKRQAVWWALLCARRVLPPDPPDPTLNALRAAERWVRDPGDDHCRAALPAAEAAGLESPAGCAALAAFLSGGSMAPPELPAVAPPAQATAQAVSGAAMLAAVITEPHKAPEKYKHFLDLGADLMSSREPWNRQAGGS
jgi:hypothetical protein